MALRQPLETNPRSGVVIGALVGLVVIAAAVGAVLLVKSGDACCPVRRVSTQSGSLPPTVQATLERDAGEFADANSESVPSSAEAVLTTRQASLDALGGGTVDSNQPVYLVQMEGRFVANSAPRPNGADAPTGTTFWFLYDPAAEMTLDWGLGEQRADLTQLGEIVEIHPTETS